MGQIVQFQKDGVHEAQINLQTDTDGCGFTTGANSNVGSAGSQPSSVTRHEPTWRGLPAVMNPHDLNTTISDAPPGMGAR